MHAKKNQSKTLAALFLTVFDRAFRSAPAVPERDPYLQESLHHGS